MIARQTAVQTAIGMKGQREEVAKIYNSYLPHPRGYKVKWDSDLLCATYVSSVFIKLGEKWTTIVPPECAAWRLYQNMDALGCGVQDRKRTPDIGDLIFFGNGTKMSNINHVGIVTEVKGKQIYYYDIQSVVGRHTCPVGYAYIWGYGIPDYASIDAQPSPTPPAHEFQAGDLVTINPGAKWYKGQTIKISCITDKWYISAVKGDRAVLGMNEAQTRNICSPIHTSDITLVPFVEQVETKPSGKKSITIDVDQETYQLLQIMAQGAKKSMGEIVDLLLEDAR